MNFILKFADLKARTSSLAITGDWVLIAEPGGSFARVAAFSATVGREHNRLFRQLLQAGVKLRLRQPIFRCQHQVRLVDYRGKTLLVVWQNCPNKPPDDVANQHQLISARLLQLAVMDNLLGPANGPHEQIADMFAIVSPGLESWHLVKQKNSGIEGQKVRWYLMRMKEAEHFTRRSQGGTIRARNSMEQRGALMRSLRLRRDRCSGNQSLITIGFVWRFVLTEKQAKSKSARWGRYERDYETEIYKTKTNKETGAEEQGPKAVNGNVHVLATKLAIKKATFSSRP